MFEYNTKRLYITVVVEFSPEGDLFPVEIRLDDGTSIPVERRLVTPLYNLAKSGSDAWRFLCLIEGMPMKLFYDASSYRLSLIHIFIADEVIPETHSGGNERLATFALIIGFVIMMVMDIALG